ncbi:OLC1v1010684C1 [Oldenlandia corymbosa var. corymbosa]|uniref:OLC1v1010684C1 n=1 Tax=Oldenlandia corymbosa var. corymbosa TaxID=529605 RepID=A0AAV1DRV3_OLDCO|nr:OLC1v1010684C1 [Oldenlandia corymbosa var. corymbosa]
MIKRRFYKLEHGDRDAPSESSSSSSDFELEANSTDESEEEEVESENDDRGAELREHEAARASSSSGYESEDSSANEVHVDSSGLPTSDDDGEPKKDRETMTEENVELANVQHDVEPQDVEIPSDIAEYVVKRKSVFKCKLCPRIVCLTEDSIRAHLKSKRHARSEKLLREGRLKLILDDEGKLDGEANAESESTAKVSALCVCPWPNQKDFLCP